MQRPRDDVAPPINSEREAEDRRVDALSYRLSEARDELVAARAEIATLRQQQLSGARESIRALRQIVSKKNLRQTTFAVAATLARVAPARVVLSVKTRRVARLIKRSGLFDPNYYSAAYPDVVERGSDPFQHFVEWGVVENRDPHAMFSSAFYLERYPDVASSGLPTFIHFLVHGAKEHRRPHPDYTARDLLNAIVVRDEPRTRQSAAKITAVALRASNRGHPRERTAICVSHVSPWPSRAGNEYRIDRVCRWLESTGRDVYLVLCPLPGEDLSAEAVQSVAARYRNLIICRRDNSLEFQTVHSDVREMLEALSGTRPRAFAQDVELAPQLLATIRVFSPDFLTEVVSRLSYVLCPDLIIANYIFTSGCFADVPDRCLCVIDTHDVFSTKKEKVVRFGIEDSLAITGSDEATLLRRGDLVLAIQPDERRELLAIAPDISIVTAGVDFDLPARVTAPAFEPTVFFVASSNAMNVRGLRDFVELCWPLVRARLPHASLRVAGSVGDVLPLALPGIEILGRVADLASEYARARLVINPAVAGTGLKIKTVEALAHGRPIVLWPSGMDGLPERARDYCHVATNWWEFAQTVIALLSSENLSYPRLDLLRELFSADAVYAELVLALANARAESQRAS